MPQVRETTFACAPDQVRAAAEWAEATAAALGLRHHQAKRVALVLEELFANTINHGRVGRDSMITATLSREPARIRLDYLDSAAPFDPIVYGAAREAGAMEAPEFGGQGIMLMRRMCSDMRYRRDGERNHVTLWLDAGPA